ncbi:MAG: ArsR family transcriptional regulator [Microbacteriaceae bacterium]|nr:MAG: ArsR family transcriptional regulator [Microbacteriaceae bacterium]
MTHPFEVLAEPIRRRIVEVLAVGEHSAGQLADVIGHEFAVGRTSVSHHLRTLRDNDFVIVAVELSSRLYRLNPEALDQLDESVASLFDLWDQRYGYRYDRDPLPPESTTPRRSHRLHGEGSRLRRQAGMDPWQSR